MVDLEDRHSSCLKDLTSDIKNKFNPTVEMPSNQKLFKSLGITWRIVLPIPQKSNKAAFLQQHQTLVLNRVSVTDVGMNLISIDQSWFNSQTRPTHRYSLSGRFSLSKFFFFFYYLSMVYQARLGTRPSPLGTQQAGLGWAPRVLDCTPRTLDSVGLAEGKSWHPINLVWIEKLKVGYDAKERRMRNNEATKSQRGGGNTCKVK